MISRQLARFLPSFGTYFLAVFLPIFILLVLVLSGRVVVNGTVLPVSSAVACTPGVNENHACTISSCCTGTEVFSCEPDGTLFSDGTCYDTGNCATKSCSAPPDQVCTPNADVGCPGGADFCSGACTVANYQPFCNSAGTACKAPILVAHSEKNCGRDTACSGGSCVASPGSCGGGCVAGTGCAATGAGCPVICQTDASGQNTGVKCWSGKQDACGTCDSCGGDNGCITDTAACPIPTVTCGTCSKSCGGGVCSASGAACNTQACASVTCGACSASCGGGTKSCSDGTTQACNTQACAPATCGACSASCGGGTQSCSDGSSRACNTQACSVTCGACSVGCGGGTQSCSDGSTPACNSQACPCSDTTWNCVNPYNGTETSNCGTVRTAVSNNCAPRFITAGGASVYSVGSITGLADANYPAAYPYFNPSQYGVVSSAGDISLSAGKINIRSWKVTNYASQITRYDHDYFWSRLKDKVVTTLNANSITSGDLQVSGTDPVVLAIRPISGNTVTFNTPINVGGGKLLVVFINALDGTPVNLTVGDKVTVGGGGFIIWIVSGNVNVASAVSQADGYYISTGSYSDGSGSTQLTDSGGVAAYGGINLGRVNSDTSKPSEAFSYNNDITKFAPLIGESLYNWSEIVP